MEREALRAKLRNKLGGMRGARERGGRTRQLDAAAAQVFGAEDPTAGLSFKKRAKMLQRAAGGQQRPETRDTQPLPQVVEVAPAKRPAMPAPPVK